MAAPSVVFVGLACVDFIAEVPRLPAEDTEVRATGMRQAVGGNSANSSRVAARLGLDARLFAPFGDASDPSGAFALKDLRAQGVRVVEDRIEAPIPTSFITVAANTGSRTIVSCKHPLYRNVSAAAFEKSLLAGELLPKCYIEGDVETDSGDAPGTSESETPAAWIHFEGRDGPDVAQCVQTARRICPGRSTTISLELEKLAEGREESLMAIVPDVDVTFISSEFARGLGCTSAAAAAKRVCSRMRDGGTAVCAFGADGGACAVKIATGGAHEEPEVQVLEVPARQIAVVDSVGAGDTFNAAFIASMLLRPGSTRTPASAQAALKAAVFVATEKCTSRGFDIVTGDLLRAARADPIQASR